VTLVDDQETLTPTVRATARRSVFWVAAITVALVIVLIGVLASGNTANIDRLAADNPGPAGAQALVEVLRQQGVDVTVTSSLAESRRAIDDPATTTVFFWDRDVMLDDEQSAEAARLADTVVLLDPGFGTLEAVAPQVAQAGFTDGVATAECEVFAATQAGTVTTDGAGFRILDEDSATSGCFPNDDIYSLVRVEGEDRTITVLGTTSALSNEIIAQRGNAALALNLLGENEHLVWYIPTIADLVGGAQPTLGELSPPWVTPAILTVLLAGLAAAFWRGRRFGPLIVENLPVVVRASETMQGRARLYQTNSSRLHALDALRIGTVSRLATACGLSRTASVDDVVASVANVTSSDLSSIRHLLLDAVPHSDRELVALSDALLELERTVARVLRPR
jgi:hypothetical protein